MNEWIGKNNKAFAILRVSSLKQKDNISHDVQLKQVKEHCERYKLDLQNVEKIIESAKDSGDRKRYRKAMALALKQGVRHILFYMSDREARNLTDVEENGRLVRENQIVIHYVRDNLIFHSKSSEAECVMREIQAVQSKAFSRTLSNKVVDVQSMKAESGWYPGNKPPLGYMHEYLKDENGRTKKRGTIIVPDSNPRNINLVRREFALRAEGLSYKAIRERIVAEGLRNSTGYYISAIEKRLKNPFYRGKFEWNDKTYSGNHDLIIATEILKAVDQTLGLRAHKQSNKNGVFSGGFLSCEQCGCQIVYDPKVKVIKSTGETRTFHYYHCTNGRSVHQSMRGMSITEDKIWEGLGSAIGAVALSEEFANDIAVALNEVEFKCQRAIEKQMSEFKEALEQLDRKSSQVLDLFLDGKIDEDRFKREDRRIKEERFRYVDLIEQAQKNLNSACLETAKSILELATSAKSLWLSRSREERRDFLKMTLSNLRLDGATVRYEFKKPFEILCEMKQKSEWRPQGDSNSCILREREVS